MCAIKPSRLALALTCLASAHAMAHTLDFGTVAIIHPVIQEPVSGANSTCAYMKISNRSEHAVALLGATTSIAERTRLVKAARPKHAIVEIARVEIPPGQTVSLKRMGLCLQMDRLKLPLYGGSAQGQLFFADRAPLDIEFVIESRE
jgi:copper(I)-binding protein